MSSVLVSTAIATILWGNLLYKLLRFRRRPQNDAQRANSLALLCMALCFTVLDPPLYAVIDRVTGVPNLARLLANSSGVVAACAFAPVATELSGATPRDRGIWDSWWLMALTLALMIGLFFRADLPISAPGGFPERYDTAPAVAAYRCVFLGYIGLTCCRFFVLWQRFSAAVGSVTRPALRRQVRLQTVGWALGAAYCAQECAYILLRATGAAAPSAYSPALAYGLLAGCFALILSDGFFSVWDWGERYRTYGALSPLWHDLFAVLPGIALDPSHAGRGRVAVVGDLDFRLHRRATEIRDGVMTLQPYLDRAMVRWARRYCLRIGVAHEVMGQYVEAVTLAAAIRARRRKERARRPLTEPLLPDTADPDGDVQHLRAVAAAYRRVAPTIGVMMDDAGGNEMTDHGGGTKGYPTTTPQRSRRSAVSRMLTEIFAPAPVGIVALVVVAWRFSPTLGDAMKWLGMSALFVVILPFAFLIGQVRRGRVTDIHVRRREQRLPIILVFLSAWLVLIALLATLGAPHELIALIGAGMATLVVIGAITLRWKISLHVGVASGVLTVFTLLFGFGMLALVPLLPLIGWARIELRDHTFFQVFAGALVGSVVSGGAFMIALTLMQMPS
ncbi:MAG: hypothetical protein M3Y58_13495, partial [Chloroflexota bacterium]|nr:hypothetical protein [Chloroflexota bacterium]